MDKVSHDYEEKMLIKMELMIIVIIIINSIVTLKIENRNEKETRD